MHPPDLAARREQARLLYVDTDLTLKEIAARLGTAKGSISAWAKRYDWPRRSPDHYSRAPIGQPVDQSVHRSATRSASSPETNTAAESSVASDDATAALPPAPSALQILPKQRRPVSRRKRPPIKNIVDRLYNIINHNLELMENRMSDDDKPADANNPERDMRAISSVVRSVDKLKEIEPEQSKRFNASSTGGKFPLSPEEEDRLRREIVERLLKLRERK